MADYPTVILFSLIGGLFSLIGGALLLLNKRVALKVSHLATPFAAGALLGAAFFDILPEAVEINAEGAAFRWVVVGIISFFLLEHYLHWFHHHHEHKDKAHKSPTVSLIIIGDTLHNAIDGVAIGAAFLISVPTGIVTTLAIAAHEIPQEIGDFGLLMKLGMARRRVLIWNALSALATLISAVGIFWLGSGESLPLGAILGLTAGLFIYIAASDLIPTIHEEAKGRFAHLPVLLLILGVCTVGAATEIAHKKIHDAGHHQETNQHCEVGTNRYYDKTGKALLWEDCETPPKKNAKAPSAIHPCCIDKPTAEICTRIDIDCAQEACERAKDLPENPNRGISSDEIACANAQGTLTPKQERLKQECVNQKTAEYRPECAPYYPLRP